MDNYSQLVDKIARLAKVSGDEIERKVEAKRAKLSGLISKEGAAQIVAAELGIVFDNERMKLSEVASGMKRVNVVAQITQIFPVKSFSKNGREGKIGSLLLGDDTSNVRTVLWDLNHINLLENGDLKEGDFIEIGNGSVRNGELHLSAFSDLKKSKEVISNVIQNKVSMEYKLSDLQAGKNVKARAVIVQVFEPKFFDSKNEPGKKVALMNVIIDDGTATARCVIVGDNIKKLGLTDEDLMPEKFASKKSEILGMESYFSGNVRNNAFFNAIEVSVDAVEPVDVEKLISELESKIVQ